MTPLAPSQLAIALAIASAWIVPLSVAAWRMSRSRSLDEVPSDAPADPPMISVIIPARNERQNIARCIESVRRAQWPALELVVVDDRSTDGTGDLARAAVAQMEHAHVLKTSPLPDGWVGKPWACQAGAQLASGSILCFIDADTVLFPDLVPRAVRYMDLRGAEMLSIICGQELGSFWELVIQPHVFSVLGVRYGGTEVVNRSQRAEDKMAIGQCIFIRRATYDAVGGHAAVRNKVAEDVALAQLLFRNGRRPVLVLGRAQLVTRMYTSLREIVDGWTKIFVVAGRDAVPFGRIGRVLLPVLLPLPPAMTVAAPLILVLTLIFGGAPALQLAAAMATAALVIWWTVVYRWLAAPLRYVVLFPLGGLVLLGIVLRAVLRGNRVTWKGRTYHVSG